MASQLSLTKATLTSELLGSQLSTLKKVTAAPSSVKFSARSQKNDVYRVAAVSTGITVSSGVAASGAIASDSQITDLISQVESFAKDVSDVANQAYETSKNVAETIVDAAKPVIEAATPVITEASKKAYEAAAPVASDVAVQATKALKDSGVDLAPVVEAAKTAVSVSEAVGDQTSKAFDIVSPYTASTIDTLLAQEPAVLAALAGGLFVLYLAAPSLASSLAYSARGFAGEYTAAQTLDLLTKEDYTLIDVRTDAQKSRSGVPSLPRNCKNKFAVVSADEVPSKLRGQLRNPKKVEAELCAIKISGLKRLNKGSKVVIIDSNGDMAKLVARSLAELGFKNTFVVRDGVDGSNGWAQSQLALEGYAEVFSPSRVLTSFKRGTTTSSGTQKLLPGN